MSSDSTPSPSRSKRSGKRSKRNADMDTSTSAAGTPAKAKHAQLAAFTTPSGRSGKRRKSGPSGDQFCVACLKYFCDTDSRGLFVYL